MSRTRRVTERARHPRNRLRLWEIRGQFSTEVAPRTIPCAAQMQSAPPLISGVMIRCSNWFRDAGLLALPNLVVGISRRRLRRRWPGVSAGLCLGRPARRTPDHTLSRATDQPGYWPRVFVHSAAVITGRVP